MKQSFSVVNGRLVLRPDRPIEVVNEDDVICSPTRARAIPYAISPEFLPTRR